MKIFFPQKNPKTIVEDLVEALGGRQLGKILSFEVTGKDITITVSKLGTSILQFTHKEIKDGLEYVLTKEKIALTHKPMRDEMMGKLKGIVEEIGGTFTTKV
jgi:hypothetical protein